MAGEGETMSVRRDGLARWSGRWGAIAVLGALACAGCPGAEDTPDASEVADAARVDAAVWEADGGHEGDAHTASDTGASADAAPLDAPLPVDASAPVDAAHDGGRPDTDGVSYAWDARPIFLRRCGTCHGGLADLDFARYASTQEASGVCAPGTTKAACGVARIRDGSMPMGGRCTGDPARDEGNPSCLTAVELAVLDAWLAGGQRP